MFGLCACISHQYKPDTGDLLQTSDCSVFNGHYALEPTQQNGELFELLFGGSKNIETVDIQIDQGIVQAIGFANQQQSSHTRIDASRSHCENSVLTIITKDKYSGGGGLISSADDQMLEIFAPDENTLYMRLVSRSIGFVYILPLYFSSDEAVKFKRISGD